MVTGKVLSGQELRSIFGSLPRISSPDVTVRVLSNLERATYLCGSFEGDPVGRGHTSALSTGQKHFRAEGVESR